MRRFAYQLKQAYLNLKIKAGFVAAVAITMGTTLGALICVLTLGYLLIIAPLPYPEQDRLYNVAHHLVDGNGQSNYTAFSYPGLIHLYQNNDVFEQSAIADYAQDVVMSIPHQPRVKTGYVTPEWFELLGANMLLGRRFEASEALDTHHPVAVLTYDIWQQEFDADPEVVGQTISLSGVSFSIIGVLSKDFVEPQIVRTGLIADIWFPWDYNFNTELKERWGGFNGAISYIGRLKSDVSVSQVEQRLTPLVSDTWQENVSHRPFFKGWSIDIELIPLKDTIVGESPSTVYRLLAGVIGLVLIALANVVNLFMSRTAEQQRQLCIQAALGAKKSQLVSGIFAESLLLMLLSIALAMVISSLGFAVMQQQLSSELPRINELGFNTFTVLSAIAMVLVIALIFAWICSKMINYRALNMGLQSSGKGTGVQVSKRLRQFLIALQVAVASTLIFINIVLFNAAAKSITEEHSYNIDNMFQIIVNTASYQNPPDGQLEADMQALQNALLALPQIEEISQARSVLDRYRLRSVTNVANGDKFTLRSRQASHNYFSVSGQKLLEGDVFSEADIRENNRVLVVNDVFAKRLNPNGSVVGMKTLVDTDESEWTIIGVVEAAKLPASDTEKPIRAYSPNSNTDTTMTLKLSPGQSISRDEVVATIKSISSQYALFGFSSLEDQKRDMLFTEYTTLVTTAALALTTLFLAGVGLYGILSYSTQMRRFELGTRLAIGAKRASIVALVVRDNVGVILLGICLGAMVTMFIYGSNQALLESYINQELVTVFIITLLCIFALSLFACYWPLRRYINRPAFHSLRGSD